HSFSNEIIRAIEDVCELNDVHMFVCNADDNPEKEKSYMEMLIAKQVDGLIIFPTGGNMEYYQFLKQIELPIVFIDRNIEPCIYPTFMWDNELASNLAVCELIQSNKDKMGIVCTTFELKITPRFERIKEYYETLINNHLKVCEEWIVATKRSNIINELEKLLESGNFPNAFFAVNYFSLIELLKFLKSKDLQIPEQISVISIDDSPFLEISTPPT